MNIMIRFLCPGCKAEFEVDNSFAGQKANCSNCKTIFIVPLLPEEKLTNEIVNLSNTSTIETLNIPAAYNMNDATALNGNKENGIVPRMINKVIKYVSGNRKLFIYVLFLVFVVVAIWGLILINITSLSLSTINTENNKILRNDSDDMLQKKGEFDKNQGKIIPEQSDLKSASQNIYFNNKELRWRMAIPCQFDDAFGFNESLACVKQNGQWGFIDKTGKIVIPYQFDETSRFIEGLAAVRQNGKYGFINKTGEIVIPYQFDFALPFSEDLACVEQNGKWGFINKTGKIVIPYQFDFALFFKEGLANVRKKMNMDSLTKLVKLLSHTNLIYQTHRLDALTLKMV